MENKLVLSVSIILAFILGVALSRIIFTGKTINLQEINLQGSIVIPKIYTWTRAICNQKNECADIEITCREGVVESIVLLSNVVQNSELWQDPRNITANNLCK